MEEIFTGTKINRVEWNKLYNTVKKGDTIVFDSVSRMSRNAEEGITTYLDLFAKPQRNKVYSYGKANTRKGETQQMDKPIHTMKQ